MFRPVTSAWLEILVERSATGGLLAALARRGVIELEKAKTQEVPFELATDGDFRRRLESLLDLKRRYDSCLPEVAIRTLRHARARTADLDAIARALDAWIEFAEPRITRLRELATDLEELALLDRCLAPMADAQIDLGHLVIGAGDAIVTAWLAYDPRPRDAETDEFDETVMVQSYPVARDPKSGRILLGLCGTADLPEIERFLHAHQSRFARIPDWLTGTPPQARAAIGKRARVLEAEKERLEKEITDHAFALHLPAHLAMLERHAWLHGALSHSWQGKDFMLITGWVPEDRSDELREALDEADAPYLLRVDAAEQRSDAPVVFHNPSWVRRFEMFVRGFGMPSRDDVDPSPLLAVLMPLMFGYMFGDVGQGLVLAAAGLLLAKRFPVMGLFVPAGLMAAVFGLVFGSVFSIEHWLHPLWMNPLENPMLTLAVPLAFGTLLIITSMLFAGIQAHWRRSLGDWAARGLPILVIALGGLIAIIFRGVGIALVVFGVAWVLAANAWLGYGAHGARGALAELGKAAAELIETLMQLVINTLSFARIGAFALAHAGLSSAVVTLAELPQSTIGAALVLILGNVVIIVLEGLIVSIQTTRLIMFEFFRRFVRAEGRPFQPLALDHPG